MLRTSQLSFQYKAVAREGPAAWRARSVAGAAPNALLQRRGRPQLCVRLPLTAGGVSPNETAVYVREVVVRPPRKVAAAAPRPPLPAARGAAAPATPPKLIPQPRAPLAALNQQQAATPPRLLEQPAKRSRLAQPGGAVLRAEALAAAARCGIRSPLPLQPLQQQQQQQQRPCHGPPHPAGHLIARSAGSASSLSSTPVVIHMPPSATSTCRSAASASSCRSAGSAMSLGSSPAFGSSGSASNRGSGGASAGSASPLGWLQRLSAGVSRLLTPEAPVSC